MVGMGALNAVGRRRASDVRSHEPVVHGASLAAAWGRGAADLEVMMPFIRTVGEGDVGGA